MGHVKSEMFIQHVHGEVKRQRCISLLFRAEVWTGDINLGVVSSAMVFKAMKLHELTKE